MLRDVFYYGAKPNVHPREQYANNLEDARQKCTTDHFWIINEFCDYRNFDWDFDFEFLPDEDVWAEDHNNAWPSQHQKDSGTWLCPKQHSDLIIYRGDVDPVIRKNEKQSDNWVELDLIDHSKFDFSWHPDPTDPPYIYKWGCKFFPAELKHVLEYRVPGATQEKYMLTTVELLPQEELWIEHEEINKHKFDMSWRPNPLDPPFIYVWGNKFFDGKSSPTLEYHTPGATDKKYMPELVTLNPSTENFEFFENIDKNSFDFTWKPNPTSPPYIYAWGNQWNAPEDKISIQYVVPGATEYRYMDERTNRKPCMDNWVVPDDVDTTGFDFSWEPSPAAPPYIYEFATQWQKTGGPQYVVPGATEKQYVDFQKVKKLPSEEGWTVPSNIDSTGFDFSWHPDATSPPYVYVFATQWAFSGGPVYTVPGATETKYVDDQVATAKADMTNWVYDTKTIDVDSFDFSWHPYVEDQPYIYEFGTQWQRTGGPKYITPGADSSSPVKYIDTRIIKAKRIVDPSDDNWKIVNNYKVKDFDFSWHPDSTDEPYIYVFGNNLYPAEEMPTIEYHVPGAKQVKFVNELSATLDQDMTNWEITQPINEESFDFSWKPNPTDPPYIYRWGNKYISNKYKATVEYIVPGATEIKYMTDDVEVVPEWDRWEIPSDIDTEGFDFTWRPDPLEPDLIYEFATQWQKTGGPRYIVPGATETKYLDFQKVTRLSNMLGWNIPENVDTTEFDFSWHPDATDPAYIYQFGTQWALTGGPTYAVPGATEIKYMDEQTAKALPDRTNWVYDETLTDIDSFDFSWHPYVEDQPYIYEFGTQWQKTGGPKYITPGSDSSSPTKYIDTRILKSTRLPNPADSNWKIVNNYKIKEFDFSWHPDNTEEPYIYVFGNNLYPAEECATIEYRVPGATTIKFISDIVATLDVDLTNWDIPENIDMGDFDLSWIPNPNDPPYIYEFGTQHQKTDGPRYIVKGATETKYLDFQKVTRLPSINDNWNIISDIDLTKFDFSWHPDATDPAYIYAWGNQWVSAEDRPSVEYVVPGATEYRYMDGVATKLPTRDNWIIPDNVDTTGFDFSWEPSPKEEPYIYQFGTQWQKMGGPKYVIDSESPVKYVDVEGMTVVRLPDPNNSCWVTNYKIKDFDYSWHPDETEEPYIYVFGNNLYPAEEMPTVEYHVPGAQQIKFVSEIIATLDQDLTDWEIPDDVDTTGFDFSWKPNPTNPPYIYEFATQWQKTGGPKYKVPGATEKQYLDFQKVKKLPSDKNWKIPSNIDSTGFDFSWHPDDTSPPYVYVFATQWAFSGGPVYTVPGATEIKYVDDQTATATVCMDNWVFDESLIDVNSFDFSWHPYVEDQPYIYEFGTQWQKTGGPKYITPGADSSSPTKYIDTRILKSKRLPHKDSSWSVVNEYRVKNFDYSWHPDTTEEPYIYVFGNNFYSAEECPTIEYRVKGATKIKYVSDIVATLDIDMRNWKVPSNINTNDFDFSWIPKPNDPPYIYEFATQWQKTGGPKYVVKGATETKYLDFQKATILPSLENWDIPEYVDMNSFDFSWHPDATDPGYIYQFGTQWALTGGPRYIAEGASEVKYMDEQTAKALPNKNNWEFDETLFDVNEFDFSWHPYVEDKPYIYVFGTQHQKTGGPKYITPGAKANSPVKYVDTRIIKAKRLPKKNDPRFKTLYSVKDFDYSWHPDETEEPYIYVFGNNLYPAEEMPTVQYQIDGATQFKYVDTVVATLADNKSKWKTKIPIDESKWDFSWVPNPNDPPYIYVWGNQWNPAEIEPTIEYVVKGATEYKYMNNTVAVVSANKAQFKILHNIDEESFDFSWRPNPKDPAYIYVFGNKQYPAEIMPTVEYHVKGATDKKYVNDIVANLAPDKTNYKILEDIVESEFDFSWVPNPKDPPYIYVFGNSQYPGTIYPTVEYHVEGATDKKYVNDIVAKLKPNTKNFNILHPIVESRFDFSWRPNPKDPAYIYVFGNNQYSAEEMPTVEYKVEGATEYKYVTDIVAILGRNMNNWVIPEKIDVSKFDFSWVPHPKSPPYIYQFGTKLNNNDGPRYNTPGNNGEVVYLERVETDETPEISVAKYYIETTLEDLINQHPNEIFWAVRKNIDYTDFDFMWRPGTIEVAWELEYVHVFGSMDSELTQTYFVSADHYLAGNTSFKFVEEIKLTETTLSQLFIKPDMFYVDRGNSDSAQRFEQLKARFGNKIQKTRYLNSWVDTINRCINRATTEVIWVLNSELDYTSFDFDYYPNPWQMKMVHVFGTQWSHWGTTFMVNRESFPEDTKYIKIVEHLSMLNFVKEHRAIATDCVYDIIVVDHGNTETNSIVDLLQQKVPNKNVTVVKYDQSYFNTIRSLVNRLPEKKEHYLWICSSVCDYSKFDFSYICDPFAKDNLHVFPSGKQKFGDTFLIDVNKTKEIIGDMETLEDYHKVNYNGTLRTERLPAPQIVTSSDTLVDAAKNSVSHAFPYSIIMTEDNVDLPESDYEPISLWSNETKNIIITTTGATRIIAPKEVADHVKKELYDYPYIKRAPKLIKSNPMDIVFLSNGESCADEHYEHLIKVTEGLPNRVVRVDGVNGRAAAYHAAAEASNTPWMFTVFAKLKVSPKFDWNWQPDRMQVPKHYIFHAKNPVNGLIYGHQAMIAYNKKLTLANEGRGLDFTLDDEHEIVPLISGTAHYNTDPFSTWRTAFREVLKLKADDSEESRVRLDTWLNKAEGDYSEYSIKGAVDAEEYYEDVDGDFDQLKLSYEWDWLQKRFDDL